MRTSSPSSTPLTNWLLASLPAEDVQRLAHELQPITVRAGQVLQRQGEGAKRIYFLHGGLCSLSREAASGQTVEVASVGYEGLVGISAALAGDGEASTHATMIVGGDASWISVAGFQREVNRRGSLRDIVQQYVRALVESLVIAAACSALHPIDQRLARWLLEAADRLRTSEIPLSQDTVASVLGVRRASITVATTILDHLGLIEHAHKRIRLHNRAGLEAVACECYHATRSTRLVVNAGHPSCRP